MRQLDGEAVDGAISVRGLSFRFQGSDHYALRDVNLDVAPGEFVVIAGPSGCGKSTLALAIGGYLFTQYGGEAQGTVAVAGMDVRRAPVYDVAEVVGLVQQNPEGQFCTLTVRDEVAFGLENRCLPRDEIAQRVAWALEGVGALHLVDRSLASLSGGEKQKVAIAAMMAARPQVLIFDEPTSNLDPTTTAAIFSVIERIRATANITVLVIEHKLDYLSPFSPRLVTLEQGSVVYDGPLDAQVRSDAVVPHSSEWSVREATSSPVIEVAGLHVGYNGHPVLQGLSLDIGAGEFVAVMGDNGSGKTTFLRSLFGFLKPEQGSVTVLGQDTREVSISHLARRAGFVFQNPDHQLFADSVWDEAIFAPRNFGLPDAVIRAQVEALLDRAGFRGRWEDHPYRLSYGEKRRLNLISVLSYAPTLILLDEVLIGQDAGNATFLMELVRGRAAEGATVVMVNHNPAVTQKYASRLLFFDAGRLVVDAPPGEGFRQLAGMGRHVYVPGNGRGRV